MASGRSKPDRVTRPERVPTLGSVVTRIHPDLLKNSDLPMIFGRYTLVSVLGEGGMARVFEAELQGPSGFAKPVALKIVRAGLRTSDDKLRRALVHEARIGGMLHHPNLVEVYELSEVQDFPCIAMELVRGAGLNELLDHEGALPPYLVLEIGRQICSGLHHAHEFEAAGLDQDLVHRDLKPSNVMISREGTVKVADFGIAKAGELTGATTATGIAKGTPAYMSPQQANAEVVDRRSDLFALGALLYELTLGKRLFRGDSVVSTLLAVMRCEQRIEQPEFRSELDAAIPGLADVLHRCLRLDPADRTLSAEILGLELVALVPGVEPGPPLKEWIRARLPDISGEIATVSRVPTPRSPARVLAPTSAQSSPSLAQRTGSVSRKRGVALAVAIVGALLLFAGLFVATSLGDKPDEFASAQAPQGFGPNPSTRPSQPDLELAAEADPAVEDAGDSDALADARDEPESARPASDRRAGEASAVDAAPTPRPVPVAARAAAPAVEPKPEIEAEAEPSPEATPEAQATPEPTPLPNPGRLSRETRERLARKRSGNRLMDTGPAFQLTSANPRQEKAWGGWDVTIDAQVKGSGSARVTLHIRAGSGAWRTVKMEPTRRRGEYSAMVHFKGRSDKDLWYWVEAENLEISPGRDTPQVHSYGTKTRPRGTNLL